MFWIWIKKIGNIWHLVFHVLLLKRYHRNEKDLHLWQEDLCPPPEYQLWDGALGKVPAILDSRQICGRNKQYKWLMHNYLPCEYEWINGVKLPHTWTLIKAFKARKVVEPQAVVDAKANKQPHKQTTTNKRLPLLIDNNDIKMKDGQVMQWEKEPNGPFDMPKYVKPGKNKRRMVGLVHLRH